MGTGVAVGTGVGVAEAARAAAAGIWGIWICRSKLKPRSSTSSVPAAMLPDTLPAVSPLPIENEPVDTVEIAAAPTDHVDELDQLKRMLERAVAEEAYEEAARLRDVINQLP